MSIPKIFFTDFRIERAGMCKGRGTCCWSYLLESSFMNYNIILLIARNFGSSARLLSFPIPQSYSCTSRIRDKASNEAVDQNNRQNRSFWLLQGLDLLFFTNNKLYFDLKISEFSVTSVAKKISKTKPKQSHFKAKQSHFFGGFWRKNFNFSLKIDDTKLNFLCKTKPILLFKNLIFYTWFYLRFIPHLLWGCFAK